MRTPRRPAAAATRGSLQLLWYAALVGCAVLGNGPAFVGLLVAGWAVGAWLAAR
jgi:hypothetical protein